MEVGQQVVKGVFWGSLSKFITALLYGSLLILIPRYLGTEKYGYFSLTLSVVTFFGLFIIAGVGVAAGRFVAKTTVSDGGKDSGSVILNGLLLQLILGVTLAAILFFLTPFISYRLKQPNLITLLPLGSLYLILWGLVEYFKAVLVATQKLQFLAYEAVVENLSKLLLAGGGVVILGFGPQQVLLALILALFVAFSFALSLIVKEHQLQQVNFSWLKKILHYSIPTVMTFAALYIFFELDSVMIAYFHGVKLTGAYNASVQLVKYMAQIVTPLGMVLGPTFLKLKETQPQKLASLVNRSLNYVLLVFLPISLVIAVMPGSILSYLFGKGYLAAASSFRIMSIFALTLSLGTVFGPVIDYLGLASTRAKYVVMAVTANVILNFLLIPKFGGVGAALATAFTHTPYVLANLRLVCHSCQVSLRHFLPRIALILLLAAASIGVVSYLNLLNKLIISLALIAFLYLVSIFIFKLVTFSEMQEILKGAR